MTRVRHTLLLTGFGPFPGVPDNATARLVPALAIASRAHFPDWQVEHAILPTEWDNGLRSLHHLLAELAPAIALHFGVSQHANGFQIETRARCAASALPDSCGQLPSPHGIFAIDDNLTSTFPADAIVSRLAANGLPVSLSEDAGSYLCNAALHTSLAHARVSGHRSVRGFVHVPPLLDRPPLDFPRAISGGIDIIDVCIGAALPS